MAEAVVEREAAQGWADLLAALDPQSGKYAAASEDADGGLSVAFFPLVAAVH